MLECPANDGNDDDVAEGTETTSLTGTFFVSIVVPATLANEFDFHCAVGNPVLCELPVRLLVISFGGSI